MSNYCNIAPGHPVHAHYHAREYGFPQRDDLAEQIGGPRISDERNFDERHVRLGRQT